MRTLLFLVWILLMAREEGAKVLVPRQSCVFLRYVLFAQLQGVGLVALAS